MATYRDLGYNSFLIRSIKAASLLTEEATTTEVAGDYTDLGYDYNLSLREVNLPSFDLGWNLPIYSASEVRAMFPTGSIPWTNLSSYIGQDLSFWKWIDDEAATAGASDTGWLAPTSNTTTYGSLWTNPTYAYSSDGTYTTCQPVLYGALQRLGLYDFDFSGIPGGATITGIALTCELFRTGTASDTVYTFGLSFGSSWVPNNDQCRWLNSWWPSSEATIETGGDGDLWSLPITVDNITPLTAWVEVYRPAGSVTFSVDYLALKVYYTT